MYVEYSLKILADEMGSFKVRLLLQKWEKKEWACNRGEFEEGVVYLQRQGNHQLVVQIMRPEKLDLLKTVGFLPMYLVEELNVLFEVLTHSLP